MCNWESNTIFAWNKLLFTMSSALFVGFLIKHCVEKKRTRILVCKGVNFYKMITWVLLNHFICNCVHKNFTSDKFTKLFSPYISGMNHFLLFSIRRNIYRQCKTFKGHTRDTQWKLISRMPDREVEHAYFRNTRSL